MIHVTAGAVSLLIAGLVVWLYVGRNIVARLSGLSASMHAIASGDLDRFQSRAAALGLADCLHLLGRAVVGDDVVITDGEEEVLRDSRARLQRLWARTSYEIQALRDNGTYQKINAKYFDFDIFGG